MLRRLANANSTLRPLLQCVKAFEALHKTLVTLTLHYRLIGYEFIDPERMKDVVGHNWLTINYLIQGRRSVWKGEWVKISLMRVWTMSLRWGPGAQPMHVGEVWGWSPPEADDILINKNFILRWKVYDLANKLIRNTTPKSSWVWVAKESIRPRNERKTLRKYTKFQKFWINCCSSIRLLSTT